MQTFSDKNLKTGETKMSTVLKKMLTLNGYYYKWKKDAPQHDINNPDKIYGGVFAQEVKEVFPDLVSEVPYGEDKALTVDYNGVIALLLQSVKELNDLLLEQKDINKMLYDEIKNNTTAINSNTQLINTNIVAINLINIAVAAKMPVSPPPVIPPLTPSTSPPLVNKLLTNIAPPKKQ
jgi:hypothetical protein